MAWFKRTSAGIQTRRDEQNEVPEGYWVKCPSCKEITSRRDLEKNLNVCPECGYHHRIDGAAYLAMLLDDDSIVRHDTHLRSVDPLNFTDRKPYPTRIAAAEAASGLNDGVVSVTGTLAGHPVSAAAMDFSFIGGSMGSVVGEIVARTIRRATKEKRACLIVSQSGGARMMEGALSLMQMAKTSANLAVLSEEGLPYISIMTHPTTGGVTASYAMLGDIHIAEPDALIGFAGPRVIKETIGHDLPKGFQRSEFLLEQGFLDLVVSRLDMRSRVSLLLDLLQENGRVP